MTYVVFYGKAWGDRDIARTVDCRGANPYEVANRIRVFITGDGSPPKQFRVIARPKAAQ